VNWLKSLFEPSIQDVRFGLRVLFKHPGFTAVAVLTLALGIGANSAIFSVVNAVLLRPLPYKQPAQLVRLYESLPGGGEGSVSVPNLNDWREQNDVFTAIAAYEYSDFSLQNQDQPERVIGARVSPNLFEVLGVAPQQGRALAEGEDRAGNHRVVVLGHALWQRNFAGDPQAVGRQITLGGESYTVVGVMPESFEFPQFRTAQLWTPLVFSERMAASRGSHAYNALGRLKDGVSLERAREQMTTIARRLEQQYPDAQTGRGVRLIELQEEVVQGVRPALLMLLAAVGFVLLIACTNVANLLLARAATRRREIAIRTALGAGRLRLIRQFLTESVLLSLAGGALGLVLAQWGVDALASLAAESLPRVSGVGLDERVLGFTLLLSLVTGIGFGLAPALQISKADVQDALKEGGNAVNSPRGKRLRAVLAVAEVASALVLLIGAGLLVKSFIQLQNVQTGLRPENVLTMRLTLPATKYDTNQKATDFHRQLLARVAALPGVEAVGEVNMLPVQSFGTNGTIQVEGQPPDPPERAPLVEFRAASPGYFGALGIPVVAGRNFEARDDENAPPVAVVNQTFAKRFFPNEEAVGKRIRMGETWMSIVGVVGDVKQGGLTRAVSPEMFAPYTRPLWPGMTQNMSLVVRAQGDPAALAPAIKREVLSVDPNQPVYSVYTMEQVLERSVSGRRLNMLLLTIFAVLAVTLAMIGIYSVMSYLVTQHTREIGIRMALGAQPRDVLRLILGQGLWLALLGVVLGAVGALALTRLMSNLLFGVTATDPLTFVVGAALLLLTALLACYIPARRAMKVDPLIALRYE
jgi:putative ABC transport system permease protein